MAAYYTTENELPLAEFFLLCASVVVQGLQKNPSEYKEEADEKHETPALDQVDADLHLSWAKWCSKRLQLSAHAEAAQKLSYTELPADMK